MTHPDGTQSPIARDAVGLSNWLALAGAVVIVVAASATLFWLLWRCVSAHAARFEGLGLPLPASTALALAASNWFVRLLPFLILLALPVGAIVMVLLLIGVLRRGERWAIRVLASLVSLMGLLECGACGFIVYAVHAAYSQAGVNVSEPGEHPVHSCWQRIGVSRRITEIQRTAQAMGLRSSTQC